MSILNRLFGVPEEINGANRCPTYLYRWHLWRTRWFRVYLHHFVGDDWSLDLHDHPKRFISIGLRGWYVETTPHQHADFTAGTVDRIYVAPWIRTFPPEHIHRISTPSKSCWTLVIVLKNEREWGFWHLGEFIHWKAYVKPGSPIADEMKACQ